MEVLTIGDFSFSPQSMEWQGYDVDDANGTGRDQQGYAYRDRKATKVKLVCTFAPMYTSELSKILNAIEPEFFNLKYPDPKVGGFTTMECYAGDRTAPVLRYDPIIGEYLWTNLSVNFIER